MARRRKNKDAIAGALLGSVGLALIAGLGGLLWWLRAEPARDPNTNCPNVVPAIHVVMIDRSDPIAPSQTQYVRQHIDRLKHAAEEDTRIDVYTFDANLSEVLHPILSICAPRKPESANPWVEGPARVREIYRQFTAKLDSEIDATLRGGTQPNSPIIESVRAAAQTSFGSQDVTAVSLNLTLVSDLVQNTTNVSHLRSPPNFDALQHSHLWSALRPDLKGAVVEVLYILRPNASRRGQPVQNVGHQQFWEQLLRASNGRPIAIRPVGGMQ